MRPTPTESFEKRVDDSSTHDDAIEAQGRVTFALAGVFTGLLAAWMFWIISKFSGGNERFDVIARCVLSEFVLVVALFSVILIAKALSPA